MNIIKDITVGLVALVILNGCGQDNNKVVEGKTALEIASCSLAKEFVMSREDVSSNFDQFKCVFPDEQPFEEEKTKVIYIEPTERNPGYGTYMEYKKEFGANAAVQTLFVSPYGRGSFKNLIVRKTASPPYEIFTGEGDGFRKPAPEELSQ